MFIAKSLGSQIKILSRSQPEAFYALCSMTFDPNNLVALTRIEKGLTRSEAEKQLPFNLSLTAVLCFQEQTEAQAEELMKDLGISNLVRYRSKGDLYYLNKVQNDDLVSKVDSFVGVVLLGLSLDNSSRKAGRHMVTEVMDESTGCYLSVGDWDSEIWKIQGKEICKSATEFEKEKEFKTVLRSQIKVVALITKYAHRPDGNSSLVQVPVVCLKIITEDRCEEISENYFSETKPKTSEDLIQDFGIFLPLEGFLSGANQHILTFIDLVRKQTKELGSSPQFLLGGIDLSTFTFNPKLASKWYFDSFFTYASPSDEARTEDL
jgi:hypothetical protein